MTEYVPSYSLLKNTKIVWKKQFLNSVDGRVIVWQNKIFILHLPETDINIVLVMWNCWLNLLAPKFYFAYPVYKMQKYRTKKGKIMKLTAFWRERNWECAAFFKKIQYVYFLKK
jgi:hypothetical protein